MKYFIFLLLLSSQVFAIPYSEERSSISAMLMVRGAVTLRDINGRSVTLIDQPVKMELKVPVASKPLDPAKKFDLSEGKKRFDYGRNVYLVLKDKTIIPFSLEAKYFTDMTVPLYKVPAGVSFQDASIESTTEKILLRVSQELNSHTPCKFKGFCATASAAKGTATIVYSDECAGLQKAILETTHYQVTRKWIIQTATGTALVSKPYLTSETKTAEEISRCVQDTAKIK